MTVSSKSVSTVSSFVAGTLTALTAVWLYNTLFQQQSNFIEKCQKKNDETKSTNKDDETIVMDHKGLDGRILRKAEAAIRGRTSRLVIVVERCTNDYNYSAILRSAEALGIQHVYIIAPQSMTQTLQREDNDDDDDDAEKGGGNQYLVNSSGQKLNRVKEKEVEDRALHHLFAQRATEWLTVHEFDTTKECVDHLKNDLGYTLWVTDLSQVAVRLESSNSQLFSSSSNDDNDGRSKRLPDKLAIVFGTEAVGCTTQMLNAADLRVYLPLRGFADSLNLSVATALVVHQLFTLDPTLMGDMPEEERKGLRKKWFTKLARQRLLTTGQKKETQHLRRKIEDAQRLFDEKQEKKDALFLHPEQIQKLEKLPEWKLRLEEIEHQLDEKALSSIQEFIDNPPQPISDMRRADEHRTSYVGKKTKKQYKDLWDGMPATNYYHTSQSNNTSEFFRSRVQQSTDDTKSSSTSTT